MTNATTAFLARRLPRSPSVGWAAYAAAGWAIAYAVGVRGYQGLGGTLGISGTLEDPEAMKRASLIAGAGILLAGVGALALVRPWGRRLPRALVIVPALAGSAYAMAHALTAYITKPLHAVGVLELEYGMWAERDETAQLLWSMFFYEPWFLGLGLLTTLGTVHHHRRTGGSHRGALRLVFATAAGTIAFTVVAVAIVLSRQ